MIEFIVGAWIGGTVTVLFMACFRLAGRDDNDCKDAD